MTDTHPPSLTVFFLMLFAAQSILFPMLAPEASLLSIVLTGR